MALALFFAGSAYGWMVLRGNLSASKFLDTVPLADPFAVLQVLATGTPVRPETLIGAVTITLFFGLIAGRAFCGWVCPVNLVTDAARWLGNRFNIGLAEGTIRVSRNARYWALGLSIVISAIAGVAAFEWVSPISMLHRGILFGMGAGWAAVLAIFMFDLLVVKNGFCGHICPLGGFYSLISRFSLLRVRHERERCTLCMKCFERCPEPRILDRVGKESGFVSSGECTNCGCCVEVCNDHAMEFRNRYAVKSD
jgi:ferredoxin-type protein NapH